MLIYSELGEGTTACIDLPRRYGTIDDEDPVPLKRESCIGRLNRLG